MKATKKTIFLTEIIKKYGLIPEKVIITKMGFCYMATDFEKIVEIEDSNIYRKLERYFDNTVIINIDPFGTMEFTEVNESESKEKKWLTPEEAADYLSISVSYLNQLIREGKIKVYSPDKKIRRFKKEDLDNYIQSSTDKPKRGRKPSLTFPL